MITTSWRECAISVVVSDTCTYAGGRQRASGEMVHRHVICCTRGHVEPYRRVRKPWEGNVFNDMEQAKNEYVEFNLGRAGGS
jgi:hypothetical protein